MARKLPDLSALGQPRPGEPRRSLLGLDEEEAGDALLGLIQDWSVDGDGITELCKRVSTWCLAAGRGSSMCADPNDVQWLNLCWRVGWPKPAVPETRPVPPTVEGAQFTWKQTFYALCKALNTERGTFRDAQGPPHGRFWYLRMVAEQQKPRADQRPALLERAVFEWSLNPGRGGGREVPPPVMRACARAWYAAHPAWVLDPVDVNAQRALYEELDRRLVQHVLRGEIEPLRAVIERGADVDLDQAPLLRTIEACLQYNSGQFTAEDDDDEDVPFLDTDTAFAMLEELLALGASVTAPLNVLTFAMRTASAEINPVAIPWERSQRHSSSRRRSSNECSDERGCYRLTGRRADPGPARLSVESDRRASVASHPAGERRSRAATARASRRRRGARRPGVGALLRPQRPRRRRRRQGGDPQAASARRTHRPNRATSPQPPNAYSTSAVWHRLRRQR